MDPEAREGIQRFIRRAGRATGGDSAYIFEVKECFFDRRAVMHAVEKAKRRVLARSGYLVMRAARGMFQRKRHRKLSEMSARAVACYRGRQARAKAIGSPPPQRPWAYSRPGDPPMVFPDSLLKKFLLFRYDSGTGTVVIGPVRLGGSNAPQVLEFGGRAAWRVNRGDHGREFPIDIKPRPYMAPALAKVRPQLPREWAGAVRGV
jgi:hypothetical protein